MSKNQSLNTRKLIAVKQELLSSQQLRMKEQQLPVLVLIEGWSAAGKGTLISSLIKELDPRFYNVIPFNHPTLSNQRRPFLWHYMEQIPESGKFIFLDSGWLDEAVTSCIFHPSKAKSHIDDIRIFERQLHDNGYLIVKIFLNISKKEQKHRIEKLQENRHTKWRVCEEDLLQLKKHKEFENQYHYCMEQTSCEELPWHIIDAHDKTETALSVLTILTDAIQSSLTADREFKPLLQKSFLMKETPLLDQVPLDQYITKAEYTVRLKELQKRLKSLHNRIYQHKIPIIIAYEGWDAAGKGGNIKRLSSALDPRGFEVHPIAAPEPHEKSRFYLWRFWHRIPKDGHIAIFDRSWYGRVMVERLEGFCSENDWQRAYTEINEFEQQLHDWGAIVIKFWVQIDKDTQLSRFEARENNPEKQWKITDEDWRNREKWDLYEEAVNEMIQKTSTVNAPWYIIPSNNKYYARLQAIQTVINEIEKRLHV